MNARPWTHHVFFLALLAAVVLASAQGPRGFLLLAFDRAAILRGEAWRLLTSHLVHAGPSHLVWNIAGLGLVWAALGRRLGALAWAAAAVTAALGSAGGVLAAQPKVQVMAGLSGVLHGLLAAGAVAAAREGSRAGWLYGALLAVKLVWDQLAGLVPSARSVLGGPLAAEAHLFGAIAGALCVVWLPSPPADDPPNS